MQQKWWLVAAGVVGIALAILLFPKPESPSDLPDPDMTRANPLDFKGDPGAKNKGARQVRVAERELRRPDILRQDAARVAGHPGMDDPEAVYSGRLSGPWTLVRRQLLANGSDDAKAWADQVTPLVMDLRARRRDPQAVSWDDLRSRQERLLTELRAHPDWVAVEGVEAQVDRIDELLTSFDQDAELAANNKTADGGEAAPAPSPAPEAPVAPAPTEGH